MSSSASSPGNTSTRERRRSSRNTARPDSVRVPRSPPDPFTHITSTSSRVTGSSRAPFAEVLPPAKLVLRGSEPRRRERPMRSVTGDGVI